MATRLNPTNFGYQNFFSTTLSGDITDTTLTIGLNTVPTPTSGILVIDPDSTTNREVILYTSKGASTITCPSDGRGYSSTTAVSHLQGTTVIMAPVDKFFSALASGELSTDPLRTELFYDYVASGMVWSGDAYASTRNASMTSGVMYIGGRRLTAAAVTARSFTASKDTYIDASDNGDGTVLLTYTEVANNAASPALAANSVRIGIIVTGASNIAAAGSVNQGQENKVLPIASSIPYQVTDSLGNLICPRDPNRKLLGYRQSISSQTGLTSSDTLVTPLSLPVIVPTGRKITVSVLLPSPSSASNGFLTLSIYNAATVTGSAVQKTYTPITSIADGIELALTTTPSSASQSFCVAVAFSAGGGVTGHTSTQLGYIKVELV